jgi:hypothetical protein
MVCARMDSQLKALAKKYHCTYTRYADDLTFSCKSSTFPKGLAHVAEGPDSGLSLGPDLLAIIKDNGFEVNYKKLRLTTRHYRQEVTGLTVNRFANVQRRFIRQIRAMLHAWKKYSLENAEREYWTKYDHRSRAFPRPPFSSVVRGKIEFVGQIRGKQDPLYWRLLRAYAALSPSSEIIEPPGFVEYDIEEIKKAIVVLTDASSDKQSTAFYLAGAGLVTCAHGIDDPMQLFITEARDPLDHLARVTVIAINPELDLAILKPEFPPRKKLTVGDDSALRQLDRVLLCGFPQHHVGADVSISEGHLVHEFKFEGTRRFHISSTIIQGNSGGPVLNSSNQVIGVAVKGGDGQLNEVVPISIIFRLVPSATSTGTS